jgi:hypothetical protein
VGVLEIEQAIEALPQEDWDELERWIADFKFRKWDKRLEEDVAVGRLDSLIAKAKAHYVAGQTLPPPGETLPPPGETKP